MSISARPEPVRSCPDWVPEENRTLGWKVLEWTSDYLQQPDGPAAGSHWVYTMEQVRVVLRWYAIDEAGRFLYRRGVLRRMKGWGKSPFLASLAAVELIGPCRFGGWNADGTPKVITHGAPWVQIAATNQDQTRNTMTVFPGLFSAKAVQEYDLDLGKTIIYARKGAARIEAVTSSARGLEGGRPSLMIADEALALDTPLPTPLGWTTVGAVQPGDVIFGTAGPVTVETVTPVITGRPCWRVVFDDGTSLIADDGHLWHASLVPASAKPRVRTTGEMARDGRRFAVPLIEPFDGPDLDLPVDPYVFGLWLGDGDSRVANLSVGHDDVDFVLSEVRRRGVPAAHLGKTAPGKAALVSLCGNARGDLYTKDGSSVRGALVELGVLGNKHIPPALLRASRRQRLDLLRGLMDSDGSAGKNHGAVFCNQSRQLVDGVVELLRGLGYRPAVAEHTDTRWSRPRVGYKVHFSPDIDRNPFLMPRKAQRVTRSARRWKSIVRFEPVDSVPVKCVGVSASDHLFVAGAGWTVTHNTQHWLPSNEGPAMMAVASRNLAKSRDGSARMIEITNAHLVDEGSVAEATYEAWRQADGKLDGVYYDATEAAPVLDEDGQHLPLPRWSDEQLRDGLIAARGDSTWLDVDRLLAEMRDPTTSESHSRRFYLNQVWASANEEWLPVGSWASQERKVSIPPGSDVILAVDGSYNDDSTGIVAASLTEPVHLETVWCFEPDPSLRNAEARTVPIEEAEAAIRAACRKWRVREIAFDPYRWARTMQALAREGLPVVEFPNSPERMIEATQRFQTAVANGTVTHSGDLRMARHVGNCVIKETSRGRRIVKETKWSPRKIDLAIAAVMAHDRAADRPTGIAAGWLAYMRAEVNKGADPAPTDVAPPVAQPAAPLMAGEAPIVLSPRSCQHRWFDGVCVHCHVTRES